MSPLRLLAAAHHIVTISRRLYRVGGGEADRREAGGGPRVVAGPGGQPQSVARDGRAVTIDAIGGRL